jgi:hypothetical protein
MSGTVIEGAELDHVAHAVPRWQDVWGRYAVDFGAEWSSGGLSVGFAPAQVRFGNGAKVEILMPNDVQANDFLQRFLTRNGPGPHHLTFKVPDLAGALERIERAGYEPIGVDMSDPEWQEGFIHPKEASGVVVQLAQALTGWTSPPPDDFPTQRRRVRNGNRPVRPASLTSVVHAVQDIGAATALFVGLLGGEITGEGNRLDLWWREVSWGGPMGLRLVASTGPSPTPLRAFLGGHSGRIHHLELSTEEPQGLPDSRPSGLPLGADTGEGAGRSWEIPPEKNAGLRLVALPVRPVG